MWTSASRHRSPVTSSVRTRREATSVPAPADTSCRRMERAAKVTHTWNTPPLNTVAARLRWTQWLLPLDLTSKLELRWCWGGGGPSAHCPGTRRLFMKVYEPPTVCVCVRQCLSGLFVSLNTFTHGVQSFSSLFTVAVAPPAVPPPVFPVSGSFAVHL